MSQKLTACSIGSCLLAFIQNPFTKSAGALGIEVGFPLSGTPAAGLYCKTHGMTSKCRDTGNIQLRSDVTLELINGRLPDYDAYKGYLKQGSWKHQLAVWKRLEQSGCEYSQFFFEFFSSKYDLAMEAAFTAPDILIMDDEVDMITATYRHREGGWNAFFGDIKFESPSVEEAFRAEFEFHASMTGEKSMEAVLGLFDYFKGRNPGLKLIYIHFPVSGIHAPKSVLEKAAAFCAGDPFKRLRQEIPQGDLIEISIPDNMVRTITDPSDPFFGWEHFVDETYEYAAMKAAVEMVGRPG